MSARQSDLGARVLLTVLGTYLVLIGGTSIGTLDPIVEKISLILILFLVIGWLLVRWRQHWQWHATPLDAAFVLWWIAIGASLLANNESWRRIAIGMWYIGLYTGLWFVLHDTITNKRLKRATLIESTLLVGLVPMFFAAAQLFSWSTSWLAAAPLAGEAPILNLPRVSGPLDNPNILSSLLLVLILLATGYILV